MQITIESPQVYTLIDQRSPLQTGYFDELAICAFLMHVALQPERMPTSLSAKGCALESQR